jgi:hypothetical protein
MIIHFTRIIYPDYRGFDYCGIFRGNNNRDNRGIPVVHLHWTHPSLCLYFSVFIIEQYIAVAKI